MTIPKKDVLKEQLFEELKKDAALGKKATGESRTLRANKEMSKEEFSYVRKALDLTQAQLAEVLDVSVKTVQAYEQGVGNIPGLVAKIMRLLVTDSVFKGIFIGEMSKEDYSKYISGLRCLNYYNAKDDIIKFAQTFMERANNLADPEVQTQIQDLVETKTFTVMDGQKQEGEL